MSDYKDQKELKMAMNGRMGLMTGGIILLVTAVSSTLMYGINLFSIASGAAKGEQEYTDILTQANMDISTVRFIAVCFLVLACWEIYSGIFCTMRCNRLDKAKGTKIISIVTLVAEILMQAVLFFTHMMNLGTLLLAIVVPAYMIWGATRLEKLSKLYPDRKIALNTKKAKDARRGSKSSGASAATAQPAQKKSLQERAMMNAELQDAAPSSEASDETTSDTGSFSDSSEAPSVSTDNDGNAAPADSTPDDIEGFSDNEEDSPE